MLHTWPRPCVICAVVVVVESADLKFWCLFPPWKPFFVLTDLLLVCGRQRCKETSGSVQAELLDVDSQVNRFLLLNYFSR